MIATLFRDYRGFAVPTWTIHVVAPPTNLARGIWARCLFVQREEKRPFALCRVRMAYGWTPFVGETHPCSRESSNLRDPFAVNVRTL